MRSFVRSFVRSIICLLIYLFIYLFIYLLYVYEKTFIRSVHTIPQTLAVEVVDSTTFSVFGVLLNLLLHGLLTAMSVFAD